MSDAGKTLRTTNRPIHGTSSYLQPHVHNQVECPGARRRRPAPRLCLLDLYLAKPKEIVPVGRKTDPGMQDLLRQIHGPYLPNNTLIVVDGTQEVGQKTCRQRPVRRPPSMANRPPLSVTTSPALSR